MPSEPVSIAAQSDRMSPNRLLVTITSNCLGLRTSCIAQLSAYMKRQLDIGIIGIAHLLRHLAPQPAQFHDIGLVDLAQPAAGAFCARSKATRTTRSISASV